MVVTQIGDHTARVQRLVVLGCRRERGHVPIHHLQMAEKTAVCWDLKLLPENAVLMAVQVSHQNSSIFLSPGQYSDRGSNSRERHQSERHRFDRHESEQVIRDTNLVPGANSSTRKCNIQEYPVRWAIAYILCLLQS